MSNVDIWNLNAICRCCHTDGNFKSLAEPYQYKDETEVYSTMLWDTFNVEISKPLLESSYSVCEDCIVRIRDAHQFKKQIILCERKFEEYCKNEMGINVKFEIDEGDIDNNFDDNLMSYQMGSTGCTTVKVEIDSVVSNKGYDQYLSLGKQRVLNSDDQRKVNITIEDINIKHDNSDNKIEYDDFDAQGFDMNICSSNIKYEGGKCEIELTELKTEKSTNKNMNANVKKIVKRKSKTKGPARKRNDNFSLEVLVKTDKGINYSCKVCGSSYDDRKLLRQHIKSDHPTGSYECDICQKKFNSHGNVTAHRQTHDRRLKCKYCPRKFSFTSLLNEHMNVHTKSKIFKCDLCSKEFLFKASIKNHLKLHYGTRRKCICYICGHSFNDSTNMGIHIRTVHEKQKPFTCDICQSSFSAKKQLLVHILKHMNLRPFKCDSCEKSFFTGSERNNHRCSANGSQYTCKVCFKAFGCRRNFTKHVRRLHSGERPYKCEICTKDFTCKYSRDRHTASHSGIKPFSCTHCNMEFSQKNSLERHIVRMHGIIKNSLKQIQCTICKRVVTDLNQHNLRCHYGNKVVCEICNKSYAHKKALHRHNRAMHLELNYNCNLCKKKYGTKNKLAKHQLKIHNVILTVEENAVI
ncbi:unnamed protein product [Diatraea saccharalis]|uniref:Uncharacterized protein n=1 Tax=Diatraea saccharalis TaxID=40085 RepID=A0A9N9RD96_9NEOP|nr:unnamed protein product [Diatraea saccharalis]